jgi:hypothetical protein
MSKIDVRWILAPSSGRAHLDLGERSAQSLRVRGEHIVVAACHAHINPDAQVVPATHETRCSNCVRIARSLGTKSNAPVTVVGAVTARECA